MSQKTYMYDTQWQALINAIDGGDTSAIATALGHIKTSIDAIETALGSLSADVTQDSTQWTNLINAITSGGGGGGTIDIDATQWSDLLTEISKGDMTATATALGNIKTSIDNVYTRLNSIGFDTTQWGNLVNAIINQSLTVDLSNITSSVVSNLSNVIGATMTDVINSLNSDLNNIQSIYQYHGAPGSGTNLNSLILNGMHIYQIGNISIYSNAPSGKGYTGILISIHVSAYILQIFYSNSAQCHRFSYDGGSTWTSWI